MSSPIEKPTIHDADTPTMPRDDDVEKQDLVDDAVVKGGTDRDQEIASLLRRVEQLERLTGLPDKETSLSRVEIVRNWLINTINIKLHLLGNRRVATLIALLVLTANLVFVIIFTKWQVNECVANTSVVESDFTPEANRVFYDKDKIGTWEQEIFLCSSQSLLVGQFWEMNDDDFMQRYQNQDDDVIITDDGFILHASAHFKSCTLPGFTYTDYDLDNKRCPPTSDFGYDSGMNEYRHGCRFVDDDAVVLPNYDDDVTKAFYNECPNGRQEEICVGFVSVVYYTCPLVWTALGASFGYLALVETTVVAVGVLLYMALTGKRYTYQDFFETVLPVEEAGAAGADSDL